MNDKEKKVYLETKIRNLKRKQAKLLQYPEFADECSKIAKEIKLTNDELLTMT